MTLDNTTNKTITTYENALRYVLEHGHKKEDRTGTGTLSVFGMQNRYDLSDGFPLVTTKKIFTRSLIHELLWFIQGGDNIQYLSDNNVHIWDSWADENGDLGPVYGVQWRKYPDSYNPGNVIDQLAQAIETIRTNPDSRRIIVSAWNPAAMPLQALPPCHTFFQFYVADGKLSLQLYQRSADMFLGVPFNIASYALLLSMVAKITGLVPGEFIHTFGDAHIYLNHLDQVKTQLAREAFPAPTLILHGDQHDIDDFTFEDIEIKDYQHQDFIKAPVAV